MCVFFFLKTMAEWYRVIAKTKNFTLNIRLRIKEYSNNVVQNLILKSKLKWSDVFILKFMKESKQ